RITGVDPASAANDPYRSGILSGQWLGADDRDGIVIGQPMADKLGLKAGDKPNVLVNTANGDVDSQAFVIRGIYSTRTPGFDNGTIFMSLAKAQAITRAGDHASAIFVLLKDRDQTGAVVAALQTRQFTVLTWDRMNALLSDTEELANSYMILLYLIILAITATVIVNTLVMAVFERTREIGILSALGMRSGRIMAMFFAESAMLALGGIALGLIIGGAMVAYFGSVGYYIGDYGMTGLLFGERIYAVLTLKDAINLSIAALLVTLVASVYPASLAARLEPVEALRGGRQA
ncbi:MAG TPA: FtsX-like permease family protein, partial [Thermoflexales bacterium]|nr:FtsX-like permease family protein [Thermoflexales bacterium]